jgi:hypothetical protein
MDTKAFTNLICAATGRNFAISKRINWRETAQAGETLDPETVYFVGLTLPLTERTVGFDWKTPKHDEKMLRSFITAFTSKYREPDPATYASYGEGNRWEAMTPEKREYAYGHHALHMFFKEKLLAQVQARFAAPEMETALNRWGFYETEYGVGIFCFWLTKATLGVMENMRGFLAGKGLAAKEEFSDARWVYRFRLELSKDLHRGLLGQFNEQLTNANKPA